MNLPIPTLDEHILEIRDDRVSSDQIKKFKILTSDTNRHTNTQAGTDRQTHSHTNHGMKVLTRITYNYKVLISEKTL